jgi:putative transposase
MNPHFKALKAAYQLHFYFCFKTHCLQPLLAPQSAQTLIGNVLADVCKREQYSLLETDVVDDRLRLLLSLKPTQTVARVTKMLKGNLDREFSVKIEHDHGYRRLFARGYFARSSGKVNLEAARQYVETQAAHHGYSGLWTRPLRYRNAEFRSPAFPLAHSFCVLNYHVVLATHDRIPMFDEVIAPGLFEYAIRVGEKHGFAIERMGLVPDHFHLLLEAKSDVAVEECARALLDNTRAWMERRYWGVLKEANAWNVWQPSYYAGTVGEYTTAQVEKFLKLKL